MADQFTAEDIRLAVEQLKKASVWPRGNRIWLNGEMYWVDSSDTPSTTGQHDNESHSCVCLKGESNSVP